MALVQADSCHWKIGPDHMVYLRWTEGEVTSLGRPEGITELYAEVDDTGTVRREIGLNEKGEIVHYFPSDDANNRGVFDLAVIDAKTFKSSVSASDFQAYWNQRFE